MAVGDLRIVNYNVLGFDGTPSTDLGTVLKAIGDEVYNGRSRPIDVLAIQEVQTQATTTASVVSQLNALYGAGRYRSGTLNGTSTAGNQTTGLIYNTQTITLVSEVGVGTVSGSGAARQPIRYQLRPIGVPSGNDFYVYNSHYKATSQGTEAADAARRNVEAQQIRLNADALGQGAHVIYTGDFNTKSSTEASFQTIIGTGNGQGIDPVNRLGSWSGNSSFKDVFTQAPAVNPPSGFVGGGLNDRFDFQLLTNEWTDNVGLEYVTGSYRTFANNGTVSVNGNINAASNTALASLANRTTILNLLTTVTDHLPVVVDYQFVDQSLNILLAPTSISENGGTSKATITRNGSTSSSLQVLLTSSDTTAATIPSSVTIPAGATSATVTINAVNDSVADGNQVSNIAATSSGYVASSAVLTVLDDETPSLSLAINPVSMAEHNGAVTGTVTRNTPTNSGLVVSLLSSDTTEASVSSSVTIPAGAASVTFVISAVDDAIADGNQIANISVSAAGLTSASAPVTVVDDETARLTLTVLNSSLLENGGTSTATVFRNTPNTNALTVTLGNSGATDLTVPATVTIPAGADSATFNLSAIDNLVADGNRQVTVTASAIGLLDSSLFINVVDNETASLLLSLAKIAISENGGNTTGTVRRNTPNTNSLVVTLVSSDTTAATVPASVTIPAGSDSVDFPVAAIDDSIADGTQVTDITATADALSSIDVRLSVTDDEVARLVLSLSLTTISENGGTSTATISRNTPTSSALKVDLSSSNTGAATVPASVTIPAGADSTTFTVTAVDTLVAEGNRQVTITGTAVGLAAGTQSLTVTDDEVARLTLSFSATTISEHGGITTGTVRRNTPTTSSLIVTIASSDPTAAVAPVTVTIPSGSATADFVVSAVDDLIVDGTQQTDISVTAVGLAPSVQQISVTDDDVAAVTLSLVLSSISENGGTTLATVRRNTPAASALQVAITSGDTTAATVPLTVTIAAGAFSADFLVSAVDDFLADGNQATTISAIAVGHELSTQSLTVEDDEVPTLTLSFNKSSIIENGGSAIATLKRNTPTTSALVVNVSSNDTGSATVPLTVTIPAGGDSVDFIVNAVNDAIANGDGDVVIGVAANGFVSASANLRVTEDDIATLTLAIDKSSIPEDGTAVGTVSRNTPTAESLLVVLTSSDTSEVAVPTTVLILAGQTSANFAVAGVLDNTVDGQQSAQVRASFTGFVGASVNVDVSDIDKWTWTNPINPLDTDDDGTVSPLDVLVLVNDINTVGVRQLPPPTSRPVVFFDVDRDKSLSPLDVLVLVNFLNNKSSSGATPEGESVAEPDVAELLIPTEQLATDQFFANLEFDLWLSSRRKSANGLSR